ncbi:MAG: hypothetical protein HY554_07140 [Elusimicrobia bacterium]|nr:hypothetical protein [Elusimicrobiota bacterium]
MVNKNVAEEYGTERESRVARGIEAQSRKIPSDFFLWGALSALGLGLVLQMRERRDTGIFVSQMAPVLLILGLYNKLVKVAGSEPSTPEL